MKRTRPPPRQIGAESAIGRKTCFGLDPENVDARAYLAAADRDLGNAAPPTDRTEAPSTSTAEATPTSFANGRYEVKRFLGEGGKKKVYLAHDTAARPRRRLRPDQDRGPGRGGPRARSGARPRRWAASAPIRTSSPSSTSGEDEAASPTSSPSSWAAATSRG